MISVKSRIKMVIMILVFTLVFIITSYDYENATIFYPKDSVDAFQNGQKMADYGFLDALCNDLASSAVVSEPSLSSQNENSRECINILYEMQMNNMCDDELIMDLYSDVIGCMPEETAYCIYVYYYDLNDDGDTEIISSLMGLFNSGSSGNMTLNIWQKNESSYIDIGIDEWLFLNSPKGMDEYVLEVSDNKTNGMYDLVYRVTNGGKDVVYKVYKFNGSHYQYESNVSNVYNLP